MQKQIEQTLDSREVAEMVGKQHKNLLADVRGYIEELGQLKIQPSDFSKKVHIRISRIKQCLVMTSPRRAVSLSPTS